VRLQGWGSDLEICDQDNRDVVLYLGLASVDYSIVY
jgi:hypothetical protein